MTESLLHTLDDVRRTHNGRTHREERSDIGQFLTPTAIAGFMASLFEPDYRAHVRILDAGAGAGVLFSAYVEKLVTMDRKPLSIDVIAYENDRLILPELAQTIARCENACHNEGFFFMGRFGQKILSSTLLLRQTKVFLPTHKSASRMQSLIPPIKRSNTSRPRASFLMLQAWRSQTCMPHSSG